MLPSRTEDLDMRCTCARAAYKTEDNKPRRSHSLLLLDTANTFAQASLTNKRRHAARTHLQARMGLRYKIVSCIRSVRAKQRLQQTHSNAGRPQGWYTPRVRAARRHAHRNRSCHIGTISTAHTASTHPSACSEQGDRRESRTLGRHICSAQLAAKPTAGSSVTCTAPSRHSPEAPEWGRGASDCVRTTSTKGQLSIAWRGGCRRQRRASPARTSCAPPAGCCWVRPCAARACRGRTARARSRCSRRAA